MAAQLASLRDKSLASTDRLAAAGQIWQSQTTVFPKKADYLFEWLLAELLKDKSGELIRAKESWQLLEDLLASGRVQHLGKTLSRIPTLNILVAFLKDDRVGDITATYEHAIPVWRAILPLAFQRATAEIIFECLNLAHGRLAAVNTDLLILIVKASLTWQATISPAIKKKLLANFNENCLENALVYIGNAANTPELQTALSELTAEILFDAGQLQKYLKGDGGAVSDALELSKSWKSEEANSIVPTLYKIYVQTVKDWASQILPAASTSKASSEYQSTLILRQAAFLFVQDLIRTGVDPTCLANILQTVKERQLYTASLELSTTWKALLLPLLDAAAADVESSGQALLFGKIARLDFSVVEPYVDTVLSSASLSEDLNTIIIEGYVEHHQFIKYIRKLQSQSDLKLSATEAETLGQNIAQHIQPFEAIELLKESIQPLLSDPGSEGKPKKRRKIALSNSALQMLCVLVANTRIAFTAKQDLQSLLEKFLVRLDNTYSNSADSDWLSLRQAVVDRLISNGAALSDPDAQLPPEWSLPLAARAQVPTSGGKTTNGFYPIKSLLWSARLELINGRSAQESLSQTRSAISALLQENARQSHSETTTESWDILLANLDVLELVGSAENLAQFANAIISTCSDNDRRHLATQAVISRATLLSLPRLRDAICKQAQELLVTQTDTVLSFCLYIQPDYLDIALCSNVIIAALDSVKAKNAHNQIAVKVAARLLQSARPLTKELWSSVFKATTQDAAAFLDAKSTHGNFYLKLFSIALAKTSNPVDISDCFEFVRKCTTNLSESASASFFNVFADAIASHPALHPNLNGQIEAVLDDISKKSTIEAHEQLQHMGLLAALRLARATGASLPQKIAELARNVANLNSEDLGLSKVDTVDYLLLSSPFWNAENGRVRVLLLAAQLLRLSFALPPPSALSIQVIQALSDDERQFAFDWLESESGDAEILIRSIPILALFSLPKTKMDHGRLMTSRLLRIICAAVLHQDVKLHSTCLAVMRRLEIYDSFDVAAVLAILQRILQPSSQPNDGARQAKMTYHTDIMNILHIISHIAQNCRHTLSSLFPTLVDVLAGLFVVFQRFGLPEVLTKSQQPAFPPFAAAAGLLDYSVDQSKLFCRILTGSTQKMRQNAKSEKLAAAITLNGPLSKQAPYLLQAYAAACADSHKPIPKHIVEILKPGIIDIYGVMSKFERESLFKTLIGKHQDVERAFLRQLGRDHDAVRYRGEA